MKPLVEYYPSKGRVALTVVGGIWPKRSLWNTIPAKIQALVDIRGKEIGILYRFDLRRAIIHKWRANKDA